MGDKWKHAREITNGNSNTWKEFEEQIGVMKEQRDWIDRELSKSDEILNSSTSNKEGDQNEISKADSEPTLNSTGATTGKMSKWKKSFVKMRKLVQPVKGFVRSLSKYKTEKSVDTNLNIKKK